MQNSRLKTKKNHKIKCDTLLKSYVHTEFKICGLIFSTFKENMTFDNIYFHAKSLIKIKNTLTSCVILYWKARLIQNPKFYIGSNFDNLYLNTKSLIKIKNTLTSSVIHYWKARLIQNPKFKVVESNVDNLYSLANLQVKSKKIKCYTLVKSSGHGESKT